MPELVERERRKPGARGRPVRLADGNLWILPDVVYRRGESSLTWPPLDAMIDRFHEQSVLGEEVAVADLIGVARILLLTNYDLSNDEVCDLLCVEPGAEIEALAREVFASLFGPTERVRGFTDWARASLLANGLGGSTIPAPAIHDVLAILVATNRTTPSARFIDACRAALDRNALEQLI
ncbi:hypothetical protein TA3x_002286 [Tundrisphaera sp. TA3]|uniref:hypothetical protein n=1 Tax=Tundrisphaera sp. TA3 TaxID=3435775 RepID=UPI003EBF549B